MQNNNCSLERKIIKKKQENTRQRERKPRLTLVWAKTLVGRPDEEQELEHEQKGKERRMNRDRQEEKTNLSDEMRQRAQ